MSYSALDAQDEPYVCIICGTKIKDGERVSAVLHTHCYVVTDYEYGKHTIDMNYDGIDVIHEDCLDVRRL